MEKKYIIEHIYEVKTYQLLSEEELENPPLDPLKKDYWEWKSSDVINTKELEVS